MMKGIKCKNCKNLVNDWCDVKCDSPDPELVRDCIGFEQATYSDFLRSLSDEGLAEALSFMVKGLFAGFEMYTAAERDYRDIFLRFLKQPVEKS